MAMIEGKERSISPAMTTIVSGMAMIAKNGMVDMKAKYICGDKKVSGAKMIKRSPRPRKTPIIPSWVP